uniref:C-type lectin domain-containing protein n=1 Tax=Kryptolebias marmoratus TaxID=37003 RepID=A0A3Q3AMD4_KRYMA
RAFLLLLLLLLRFFSPDQYQDGVFKWVDKNGHCDQGYLLYGNFCYHFEIEDVKNWRDAEARCVSEQGHLVSFQRQEELSFLTAHLPGEAWVGLNDIDNENHFVFTDGTTPDCVEMFHTTGRWNDVSCTELNTYICKTRKAHYPLPSVKPTHYGCSQVGGSLKGALPF